MPLGMASMGICTRDLRPGSGFSGLHSLHRFVAMHSIAFELRWLHPRGHFIYYGCLRTHGYKISWCVHPRPSTVYSSPENPERTLIRNELAALTSRAQLESLLILSRADNRHYRQPQYAGASFGEIILIFGYHESATCCAWQSKGPFDHKWEPATSHLQQQLRSTY